MNYIKKNLTYNEAAVLATFIINRVSDVDISVGEGIDWYLIKGKYPRSPTPNFLLRIMDTSESTWFLLRKLFWELTNDEFKKKVEELFDDPYS